MFKKKLALTFLVLLSGAFVAPVFAEAKTKEEIKVEVDMEFRRAAVYAAGIMTGTVFWFPIMVWKVLLGDK